MPEFDPSEYESRSKWRWLLLAAIIILLILVLGRRWYRQPLPSLVSPQAIPTAPAVTGPIERTLRLTGVTSAVDFRDVRPARMRGGGKVIVLLELAESGGMARKGDIIARFDSRSLLDRIDDQRASVASNEAKLRKRYADHRINIAGLEQSLRSDKAQLDRWKLEAGAAEIRPPISQEIIKLAVEEAEAAYKVQVEELRLKRLSNASDIRIQQFSNARTQRSLDRSLHDLERHSIRAALGGMVVRRPIFRSGEMKLVKEGDQLRPGTLFMRVMDTSLMQVLASVNQAQSPLLNVGQKVKIGLDAFPELKFRGTISGIGALATGRSKRTQFVREVPVKIAVKGSHAQLIPDLTAYADVTFERVEEAVAVPREAVFAEAGASYVFVTIGEEFEKRPVVTGMPNHTRITITNGLSAGEEVALRRPAE
ncbi:MAG: HlyD family efflux transporter periplasmic adaptor subunit [bacterium]|nr:HlyD family efflux transporter periplasmic adaptor subunit [bacterium]